LAFYGCTSLKSVTIPASVKDIDYGMFAYCTSLTAINVAAGSNYLFSENGVLYCYYGSKGEEIVLWQYPAGKTDRTFDIPNNVNHINTLAFGGCKNLTGVTIPNKRKMTHFTQLQG
jgi:hypothetical protein